MSRHDKFISFRDSALTQLLKPALTSPASCRITVLLALRSEPQYAGESTSNQRFGAVCANAASSGAGATSARLPRLPSGPANARPSTKSVRSSRAKCPDSNVDRTCSAGGGSRMRVQSALSAATAALQEAEADIKQMQEDGFDEHPVQPCAKFPAATIRSFLKNKQQFDDGALAARKWKHALMELRAQAKRQEVCGGLSQEMRRAEEQLSAAEHAVFVYSGMFYRQASTGIWIPRHKRLTARMHDRDTLQMQVAFLSDPNASTLAAGAKAL